jgi:hypothetical protein
MLHRRHNFNLVLIEITMIFIIGFATDLMKVNFYLIFVGLMLNYFNNYF